MDERPSISGPRYLQIAVDMAAKIIEGKYREGDKTYARSSLASQYGVSAETARRAVCVLADMGIVEASKGSGVIILSNQKAIDFVRQYTGITTLKKLKEDVNESITRQGKELDFLKSEIGELIERIEHFRAFNPFLTYEIIQTETMPYIGKSLSETNFWQSTNATVLGIRRGGRLIVSPGPYATFHVDDTVYFVGDENCLERVRNFLTQHGSPAK